MLPFEGDKTLSLILSKAFLLADDHKIKDPVIVAQLTAENRNTYRFFEVDEVEKLLNNRSAEPDTQAKEANVKKQVSIALRGFGSNSYFAIIGDQQAESLEQDVVIHPETAVKFMRLVPLVGG